MKLLLKGILLLLVGMECAAAQPRIPNTPAGQTLSVWLDAFNSGDRARMENFVKTVDPGWNLDGMSAFRKSTGGFNLLSIVRSDRLNIWFVVKEKNSATHAVGDLLVRNGTPPTIESFGLRALPPGVPPVVVTLDSALRHRVIDGVAANLTQFYVHAAVASQMVAALRAHQKAGAYRDLTDGFQFADRLTSDLGAVSHDLHLRVTFSPFRAPPQGAPTAQQRARMRRQLQSGNCAFEKVEILPGDIGYVKFNGFMPPGICAGTVEAAMAFVAHARALIFDLRDNHGGDPAMVAVVASYLFDHPTHLNDLYNRKGTATQFWTLPSLTGQRLATQPVFVLTSHHTVSGGEEFCYDLQNQKRATIVGETTAGGAHPTSGHLVADYFWVAVPFAEAINPISHTSWEGTGVVPDVKVPAADALATAERLATRDIQAAAANPLPRLVQQLARSTPSPGTEASLRRQIEGWEKRRPDYKDLGLGLEEFAFQQRARLQAMITRLGALKSLTFVRVARDGSDIYDARFAHGGLQWRVSPLSSDGRVPGEVFSPLTGNGVRSPRR
jgi:Peptidase family S41/N-terminal domain of Peptidase_S41 in eukaryotic IRBP